MVGNAPPRMRVLLITGMSGAGKTSALKALEDLGYEAVDNLPLSLVGRLTDPESGEAGGSPAIAISVDFRTRDFDPDSFAAMIAPLVSRPDVIATVLFLDCDNEVLSRRFIETRRRHPLADDRPVNDGIQLERELLRPIAESADVMLDTSNLSAREFGQILAGHFALESSRELTLALLSFSYRHGLPREADLVFDVRFLANPHYQDALKALTGRHPEVGAFIARDPACRPFLDRVFGMLMTLLPHYQREGKSYLTVAIGCTGGRHRSVFVAEQLAGRLRDKGRAVVLRHRDVGDGGSS